jgi:hypothetical protein
VEEVSVTAVEWQTNGASYRQDPYRIDPADGQPPGGWVLHVVDPEHPLVDSVDEQRFSSLKTAKATAIHHRLVTIRRTKLVRHAMLSIVGALLVIPAFALMGPGTSTRRVVFFVVGLLVLLLALRELVGLGMLALSDGWDYRYDAPELSWTDRMVGDFVGAISRAPLGAEAPEVPAVKVVAIDPGGHEARR